MTDQDDQEQSAPNEILIVEANIDDQSPQLFGYVMDKLLAAGALDVWMTPIIMKKGRPAVKLSLMTDSAHVSELAAIVFAETTTIGLRYYPVQRITAKRLLKQVDTTWGKAAVKISSHEGKVCHISAEYDHCVAIAANSGVPLKEIQQQVVAKALQELSEPVRN